MAGGNFDAPTPGGLNDGDTDTNPPLNGAFLQVANAANGLPVNTRLDLGDVRVDGVAGNQAAASLLIQNAGDQPLVINSLAFEGAPASLVVSALAAGTTIAPYTTLNITITFDPTVVGTASGRLVIQSNSQSGAYSFDVTGFGQSPSANVSVVASNNNLGGRALGAGAVQNSNFATIQNLGASPLSITGIGLAAAAGSDQFAILGLPAGLGVANPLVLAPGASFTFGASFDPNRIGLQSAVIKINTNDPGRPVFAQTIVGTGLADSGSALHWGDDFVSLQIGTDAPVRFRSDVNGCVPLLHAPQHAVRALGLRSRQRLDLDDAQYLGRRRHDDRLWPTFLQAEHCPRQHGRRTARRRPRSDRPRIVLQLRCRGLAGCSGLYARGPDDLLPRSPGLRLEIRPRRNGRRRRSRREPGPSDFETVVRVHHVGDVPGRRTERHVRRTGHLHDR